VLLNGGVCLARDAGRDGFATAPSPAVSGPALEAMRERYDELYGHHHGYGSTYPGTGLVQIFGAGKLAPELIDPGLFAAVNAAAAEMLAALDGTHPAFDSRRSAIVPRTTSDTMGCICKPAGTMPVTEVHQDEAYSTPAVERQGVTASLALQPTCETTGCMMFVPGSHLLPVLEHEVAPHQTHNPVANDVFDELQLSPTASATVDWSTTVAVPVPAGGITFWTPRTLHGSAPNEGEEPRRTLLLGVSYESVPCAEPTERPWQEDRERGDQEPPATAKKAAARL
jgi:hypothetical protein